MKRYLMNRYLTIVLVLTALLPRAVTAEVFSLDNETQLCIASYQGKRAVDKDALAYVIVTEAGAGLYLDGSNPTGLRDRSIQLRTSDGIPSEPLYAILHAATNAAPEENQPFGPNVNLRTDQRALQARDAISNVMREQLFRITTQGPIIKGPKLTYRVERRTVVGGPTARTDWDNPELLFRANPPLVIVCDSGEEVSQPSPPTPEKAQSSSVSPFLAEAIRLRGTVKDLTINADSLSSAKPASIGYERDGEAKTNTFGLNGVLGVRFGDNAGVFDVLPFISYENRSVTGSEGDIEKLSPGLLFGYKIERPDFAIHARLETSLIEDIRQDARQGKIRLYVDPAFALGSGQGVLFGSNLKAIGPLVWRPDLTLIVDGSHVYDKGTSTALAGANDYFGLGGELSLRARLNLGQPISAFVLQGGVRGLKLMGDIHKNDTQRWFASLDYAPESFPYFGISLSFTKGENDDTFQDEEIYSLNFTFRY